MTSLQSSQAHRCRPPPAPICCSLRSADPGELALHTLYTAIRYLRDNHLDAKQYVFAFWSRLARIAGILAALRVCTAVRIRRAALHLAERAHHARPDARHLVYFFLQRLVESGTLVFNLNPLLLAWVPTGLLALAAMLLLWRVR